MGYTNPHKNFKRNDKNINTENLAPIVLFTYNRLKHTRETINSLKKNIYAKESKLYIYTDAPANEELIETVKSVRDYLKSIDGFQSVIIVERKENFGLARNIIEGVTEIINKHGKIIVLEDDIITSRYFLKYMNDALKIYEKEKRVMQISGYMYPVNELDISSEGFFSRLAECWGWATWKDSWEYFEKNPKELIKDFSENDIYKFDFDGTAKFWDQVIANIESKIDSWAIFWYASIFKRNGLVLYPVESLTFNIGFDNTGVNCDKVDIYDVRLRNKEIKFFPLDITENKIGYLALKKFFKKNNPGLIRKIVNKIFYWRSET